MQTDHNKAMLQNMITLKNARKAHRRLEIRLYSRDYIGLRVRRGGGESLYFISGVALKLEKHALADPCGHSMKRKIRKIHFL